MNFEKTDFQDVWVINPVLREDNRGYFMRSYCLDELAKQGIQFPIAQINRSLTKDKGMIRGMHYQTPPKAEGKIVHCLQGSIFDVIIDLRPGSKTFEKYFSTVLTGENKKMLIIPKGFAHGFQALEKNVLIQYYVSEFYSPEHERGILWSDEKFAIKWPISPAVVSDKDNKWPKYMHT